MKIKQLIKELQKLDPESLVILSSDSEGNSFDKLETIYTEPELAWDAKEREMCYNKETEENEGEYINPKAPSAIVLFP